MKGELIRKKSQTEVSSYLILLFIAIFVLVIGIVTISLLMRVGVINIEKVKGFFSFGA